MLPLVAGGRSGAAGGGRVLEISGWYGVPAADDVVSDGSRGVKLGFPPCTEVVVAAASAAPALRLPRASAAVSGGFGAEPRPAPPPPLLVLLPPLPPLRLLLASYA